MLAEDGVDVEMPDTAPFQHVTENLLKLRPMREGGHADWPEIAAFAGIRGIGQWEAETLFEMAAAYAREYIGGSNPFRIAPAERQ